MPTSVFARTPTPALVPTPTFPPILAPMPICAEAGAESASVAKHIVRNKVRIESLLRKTPSKQTNARGRQLLPRFQPETTDCEAGERNRSLRYRTAARQLGTRPWCIDTIGRCSVLASPRFG